MNTIQQRWDMFQNIVIPKNAPPIQVQEMRRAFYSGAESMQNIQWQIGSEAISEDAGIAILEGVNQEIIQFKDDLMTGKA